MEYIVNSDSVQAVNEDGHMLAEVTFPEVADGIVEINRTFVDESLRGQGVAGKLLEETAAAIEHNGRLARPTCTYAIHWFDKHPERHDLLAPDADPGSEQDAS